MKFKKGDVVFCMEPIDGDDSKVTYRGVVQAVDTSSKYKLNVLVLFDGDDPEDLLWCEHTSLEKY